MQLPMLVAPSWTDALPIPHQNVIADALRRQIEHLTVAVTLGNPEVCGDADSRDLYLAETLLTDLEVNR